MLLLTLLLKVIKVTTEHQKWPQIGQHSIFGPFLPDIYIDIYIAIYIDIYIHIYCFVLGLMYVFFYI